MRKALTYVSTGMGGGTTPSVGKSSSLFKFGAFFFFLFKIWEGTVMPDAVVLPPAASAARIAGVIYLPEVFAGASAGSGASFSGA